MAHAHESATKEALEQIRKDARTDFPLTAQKLRAMKPDAMNDEDRASWVRLSREAAIRIGDREWLLSLKERSDPFALIALSRVLLANGFLNEGEFSAAHAELARIANLDKVNTRDQRRYWAIKARLGQLEGDIQEERRAIEKIMHELGHWSSKDCQSCHDDPKAKGVLPLLDVRNFWFARRFVELMQASGDAEQVRQQAEIRLKANASDDDARIFLAFALLAMGKPVEAEQRLREIPWVAFPERTGPTTRMMFAWP
jgi:tetratricopeptide (TPR) repeat protein